MKGQLPEYIHVHGRHSELELIRDALENKVPVHLRGMPGIGKSTLARRVAEDLIEKGLNVHWVQLDAYCDVHEAMQRMEADAPQILDVEGYASSFQHENVALVFDDVHSISPRHQESFSSLFKALEHHSIPFMLLGRDRDTFSIDGTYVELGPLEQTDAIELSLIHI